MPNDFTKRVATVLGSVVLLATGMAVAINEFVGQVAPALPAGWQDNAVRIGAAAVAVLLATAAAARRLTEVAKGERGLLPAKRSSVVIDLHAPDGLDPQAVRDAVRNAAGTILSEREMVEVIRDELRRHGPHLA
jgi:hypothetical protein